MGNEVLEFAESIGAVDMSNKLRHGDKRGLFKRRNYFYLKPKNCFLIVKISKSKIKPFWGVGKDFIEFFNTITQDDGNYFLVALISNKSGWVFSKNELNSLIADGSISYSENQKQYKINNYNLKDKNSFTSPDYFLEKSC